LELILVTMLFFISIEDSVINYSITDTV